jgi:hypothetical protein
MKYIDEKRMRFGYISLFATSVFLIGAAFWDYTYNNEALLNWFVSALGGLLLIAIFFFIATELILKDALDLRPKRLAMAMDEDHGAMPAAHTLPIREAVGAKASMPADSAASLSMMDRPTPSMERSGGTPNAGAGPAWQPHVQAPTTKPSGKKEVIKIDIPKDEVAAAQEAAKKEIFKVDAPRAETPKAPTTLSQKVGNAKAARPKPETIRIEVPEAVTIAAKPKEASLAEVLPEVLPETPAMLPKPKKVPPAPRGMQLQSLMYEIGSAQFRVPRGSKGHRNPNAVLESTRVLCAECGVYFRVDLDRARPMSVQCPQCSKDLGLSGAHQNAEHVKMRCRFCGDFLQMPRVADHKSTQCATCGQING